MSSPPQFRQNRPHPPPPPMAPTAPHHGVNVQHDMNLPRNAMGAGRADARPSFQNGNGNVNGPIPHGAPGNMNRTPNVGVSVGSKMFLSDNLRMYEFKKHKSPGRKPDWEIADRKAITHKESELETRLSKPAKDNRGRSSKQEFNSSAMSGFKQELCHQLLHDLHRHDQRFEWRLELIELHDIGLDSDTGKGVCAKMNVVVSRTPRMGFMPAPPGTPWPVGDAVVNLRPPVRQGGSVYRPAQEQQGRPSANQPQHGAHSARGPAQSPVYNAHGKNDQHPRPMPLYGIYEEGGHQQPHATLEPGQGHRGRDRNEGRATPIYHGQGNHALPHPHDIPDGGHGEKGKSKKKDSKKEKPVQIIEIPTPKAFHDDDSDSSTSDGDSGSEGHTLRSSDTEISVESPRSDKKYFNLKDIKSKKPLGNIIPEASREHRRRNPTEYMQETREKESDVMMEPASSSSRNRHRRSSSYHHHHPRSPSFNRDRPPSFLGLGLGGGQAADDDYLRRYDDSSSSPPSPRRRVSIHHDRRMITPRITDHRDEAELERERSLQLELENLRLERELKDRDFREDILRDELHRKERIQEDRLLRERDRERERERDWARYGDDKRGSRAGGRYL